MKLVSCKFTGLEGHKTLELTNLTDLVVLTGPNAAGKTTILRILQFALELLSKKTVSDVIESKDGWYKFESAQIVFQLPHPVTLPQAYLSWFPQPFQELSIELTCTATHFALTGIRCGERALTLVGLACTKKDLTALQDQLAGLEKSLGDAEQALSKIPQTKGVDSGTLMRQQQEFTRQVERLKAELPKKRAEVTKQSSVQIELSGSEAGSSSPRGQIDALIEDLNLPESYFVEISNSYGKIIPEFITRLLKQKKGRDADEKRFAQTKERLERLVQAKVEISEVDGKEELHVDSVPYSRASAGTQVTLAYFGITHLEKPDRIILWDEPENGLHPTRRSRLLELILDDGRQFFLSTHSPEFVPILSAKARIFRCRSDYNATSYDVKLNVEHVADRRDAFAVLDALGVYPARALFTSNVVIWVEGPTELLFYKHWLVPRLMEHKLHEGFHYTFMQYGGALIAYLSVVDAAHVESTFDLLSLCRNPIIIVDSDLREDPVGRAPEQWLKPGARRIRDEVNKLNQVRKNAALFEHTAGREVENYLPEAAIWHAAASTWKEYEKYREALQSKVLSVGRYDSFSDSLARHFNEVGVVDEKDEAIGRSRWGADNKVEMMRHALSTPGLSETALKWNCADHLARIEGFIKNAAGE